MPYDWFSHLREHDPVHWQEVPGQPGYWALTRHEDVVHVSRHPELFSSYRGTSMLPEQDEEGLARNRMIMLNQDPPEHTRHRRLVNRGFTPRAIGHLEKHITEICDGLIDEVAARGEADFVTDIAAQLPLYVICELLGVPPEDRCKIFAWSNALVGFDDPEYAQERMSSMGALYAYAGEQAAKRRRDPRDDLITTLLEPDADGEELGPGEFEMFVLMLAVAGNETTRNAASGGMLALIEHPDQWARLVNDEVPAGTAAEEIVRWVSPIIQFRRTAQADTEIRGQRIAEGEKVVVYYPAANRDPRVFTGPGAFDLGRDPNPHVGFGGGGPHFCLGAHLARMELAVLFRALAARMPDIRPAGEVRRLRSNFINGIKEMPVRFTAA
ncbi:MAG: cytochrome P450 [Streptosporangiales bacterium]|nr:cytochrome P450 [Streptosporangiales bacterium]